MFYRLTYDAGLFDDFLQILGMISTVVKASAAKLGEFLNWKQTNDFVLTHVVTVLSRVNFSTNPTIYSSAELTVLKKSIRKCRSAHRGPFSPSGGVGFNPKINGMHAGGWLIHTPGQTIPHE